MKFQPKQITKYEATHLKELQGNVSEAVIEYSLGLIPPFTNGDNIHDNAAGSGAVTATIFEQVSSSGTGARIHIDATDINPQFVAGCKALAESKNWPVDTAVMSAQEITFPDESFTHSFTSFAFHCLGDHDKAAKHVYRTLKPHGVALASIWTSMPHVEALQHAHWRTRGKDGPMPTLLPLESFQEPQLRNALKAGGFKDENIKCYVKESFLEIPDLKRWAQLAWSYLGPLPDGWSQNDEDRWDEAIADTVEQLKSGNGISKNEKGDTVLKMVACVAVAKK
ncbi:S-adenosyl-L-methionine-dependent methyltransferase [Periconia macrospinosa]|uniref:S-adenosyl-L-methionine-dependent methyltransferase n=1 Tax=Periconia macrospinosa TaxID=97972 RepID=A0A2V1DT13_9PLEO|nr:S-adenosyl-L-methionine-dependent methyltransferase [Periconia macrospinosa]